MTTMTRHWVIAIWVIATLFPFITMGVFAISERYWHADLQRAIPWLRALRWMAWIVCVPIITVGVLGSHPPANYFAIGMSMFTLSAGSGITEHWLKKRNGANHSQYGAEDTKA